MKFDRLKASIQNNRQEEPTLYMAFCMIESLFADMEAETGKDLSLCAVGEDAIATKMRWLSRCILDIFKEQQELLGSRPRMEEAMKKLSAAEAELDQISRVETELRTAKEKLLRLNAELQQGREKKAELESLSGQIQIARNQVELLKGFDPTAAEAELEALRAEIDRMSAEKTEMITGLTAAEARRNSLQQQVLEQSSRNTALEEECNKLTQRLRNEEMSLQQAQTQMEQLQQKREELQNRQVDLTNRQTVESTRYQNLERSVKALEQQLEALMEQVSAEGAKERMLQQELRCGKDKLLTLQENSQQLEEEIAQMQTVLPGAEGRHGELEQQLSEVTAKKEGLGGEIQRMEALLSAYDETELLPLRKKKESLQQELDTLQQQQTQLLQEQETLADQRDRLVVVIGNQKAANDDLSESIRGSQAGFAVLEQEQLKLKGQSSAILAQLSALQTEVEELKNQKLPSAQVLVSQEQSRKDKLLAEIQKKKEEKATLEAETALLEGQLPQLEAQLPSLTEKLTRIKTVYEANVAKVTAGTEELQKLEEKIKELHDQNDEEKHRIYHKQLEEDLKKLQNLQAETVAVQENIQALENEMAEKQKELARYQAQKEKYEAGCKATGALLQEMAPVATSDYARQVEVICQRQEMLEIVRGRLAKSVVLFQTHLGKTAFEKELSLDDSFKVTLQELRFRTEELHDALLQCANSLKMEGQ